MKKTFAALVLMLALLLPACAASQVQSSQTQGMDFYYASPVNESGSALRSERVERETISIAEALDLLLTESYLPEEHSRTFPVGTKVMDWSLESGVLSLNLSEDLERLTNIQLTEAEYCIVMTMTQFDEINAVSITVDGKKLPGAGSHLLTRQDLILIGEIKDPILLTFQLYFPLADGSGLGMEERECEVTDSSVLAQAEAIVQQLTNGPAGRDMLPFLQGASHLEIVSILDGLCTVDLDRETMELICSPTERYELSIGAIVNSITQLDGVDEVRFTMNDAPIENWAERYQGSD
ncbi:MAG: GerMN domain-containing protein [Oscillospiraceae bacterium]|nr:GerMN domain-containing protein [Oscillospiraceae bacterium]